MQRAADAAALAGVVWLPGRPRARPTSPPGDEATKNGYPNGVDGVAVTPVLGPEEPAPAQGRDHRPGRHASSRGPSGINSWPGGPRRPRPTTSLPVPMGSPENYYGVGFYEGLVVAHVGRHRTHVVRRAVVRTTRAPETWRPRAPSGGQWTPTSGTIQAAVELQQQRLRHREHQRREAAARRPSACSAAGRRSPRRGPDRCW